MSVLELLKQGRFDQIDLGVEKRLKIAEGLTEFPREIFKLAEEIEVLDLSGNSLSSLPNDFGRFKNLKILFFADNQFEHVPEVIAECSKLEMLGFKNNQIKSVPEDAIPDNVHWLILTGNEIRNLPDSFGRLTRLRKLALAGNQIQHLPDSMANCRDLELIRLSANALTELPDWLFELPKLAWLALSGNPVTQVHSQVNDTKFGSLSLEKIQLHEKIGEGASGHIYRGKSSDYAHLDNIAVKLFKGSITSDGYPEDEINCCLQAGEHLNLISVLAKVEDQQKTGLAMKLIPSGFRNLGYPPSLQTCTRDTFAANAEFKVDDVVRVFTQMVDVVRHLHERNVSHGDIYAHNTMVDDEHNVLFGDFGAATNLSGLTLNQKHAFEAIEVRALGCLLEDVMNQVVGDCDTRRKLDEVIENCLQADGQRRYSLQQLRTQLDSLYSVQELA